MTFELIDAGLPTAHGSKPHFSTSVVASLTESAARALWHTNAVTIGGTHKKVNKPDFMTKAIWAYSKCK